MTSDPINSAQQPTLLEAPLAPEDILRVNNRCIISEQEGIRIVVVNGTPVYRYVRGDTVAEDLFIAQAQTAGFASGRELGRALGRDPRTLQRRRQRLEEDGVQGLVPKKRGPKGQRLSEAQDAAIRKLHAKGLSERGTGRQLKMAPLTVGRARRRMGLNEENARPRQEALQIEAAPDTQPSEEVISCPVDEPVQAPTDPVETDLADDDNALDVTSPAGSTACDATLDTDPMDRAVDRMLASQGKLLDAAPFFAPGTDIPRVGALLAVPSIVATGLFEESERLYKNIGPAFYGLRTTLLFFVLFALLRVKRPENLKEYSPPDLGRVIGLDRAPEVKTLRRKLKILASGPSGLLIDRLAERRAQREEDTLGFLYVDGHVRVYSGKARLPKAHVTRMRMSLPATQDVWVNDANGDPVLFVTQEAHPSMVTTLEGVLEDIRDLVGPKRRVTVVFDRGGWSPRLFKRMDTLRFDVMTYHKGGADSIPEDCFIAYEAPSAQSWLLHDVCTWIGSEKDGLWMRQVTRLKAGHQTQVLTTRQDLETVEVAFRMFNRWQQENFFKYMREEYAIDALVEYGFEEEDQLRDSPNPAWKKADKKLGQTMRELQGLEADYGASLFDPPDCSDASASSVDATSNTELHTSILEKRALAEKLRAERDALPKRVTVGDLSDEDRTVRLPARRKRFSDAMKMLAYQVETDLFRTIAPNYQRSDDEGRKLITAALHSAGDLAITGKELHVTLSPQSSPHRTRAIAALCDILNATHTRFPGTNLRLCYAIRETSCVN